MGYTNVMTSPEGTLLLILLMPKQKNWFSIQKVQDISQKIPKKARIREFVTRILEQYPQKERCEKSHLSFY